MNIATEFIKKFEMYPATLKYIRSADAKLDYKVTASQLEKSDIETNFCSLHIKDDKNSIYQQR